MELRTVIEALREVRTEAYPEGVIVAADLGEHGYCELESNCPIAIKLRNMITETGISIMDLLAAEARVKVDVAHMPLELPPDTTATMNVTLAGKTFEVSMKEVLSRELRDAIGKKIETVEYSKRQIERLGMGMHNAMMRDVQNRRTVKTVPQFQASVTDLIRTKCHITSEQNNYLFLFAVEYNPRWIINNGARFEISKDHLLQISRDAFLKIIITLDSVVLRVLLLDSNGDKLEHYHGNRASDCWGSVDLKLANKQYRLSDVYNICRTAMGSVATINYNSLMQREPPDMPNVDDVLKKAKLLGREGVIAETGTGTGRPGWVNPTNAAARPGWGRRTNA